MKNNFFIVNNGGYELIYFYYEATSTYSTYSIMLLN